jgi:glycosyltransferase involved in cell wall biosynthesis
LNGLLTMSRATVIIPTFGNAIFARWAIKSVQQQTVKDLEICVICDGSPPEMVSYFNAQASEDQRIQVFAFPKAPRTGEPYRDIVIRKTSGRIICYCCHDDLWLPYHVGAMEKALQESCFAHSIHVRINVPEVARINQTLLGDVFWINLSPEIIKKMEGGENFFGLTFGAHTRNSYYQLKEGWVTTPIPDMPTDLYMWNKFLAAFGERSHTLMQITALHFRKMDRLSLSWSEQQRDEELKGYFEKLTFPQFLRQLFWESLQSCPARYEKQYFTNSLGLWSSKDPQIVRDVADVSDIIRSEYREQLSKLNSRLEAMNKEIQIKNVEIRTKNSEMRVLHEQIWRMQHGIVMQVLIRYYRVVDKLLSSDSKRRHYYELVLSGVRTILNEGWSSFFEKTKKRLRFGQPN